MRRENNLVECSLLICRYLYLVKHFISKSMSFEDSKKYYEDDKNDNCHKMT